MGKEALGAGSRVGGGGGWQESIPSGPTHSQVALLTDLFCICFVVEMDF
jgi:hypothetical protein